MHFMQAIKDTSINESILKIRTELVEFVGECEHLDNENVVAAIKRLSDSEMLALYIEVTFDKDWRGDILEALAITS